MKTSSRFLLSLISFVICTICIFFPLVFIIKPVEKESFKIIAVVVALLIGLFIWFISKGVNRNFIGQIASSAMVFAGIGFFIGFLGPIIFTNYNLGPLIGIFITIPLGLVIGLVVGAIYWKIKSV